MRDLRGFNRLGPLFLACIAFFCLSAQAAGAASHSAAKASRAGYSLKPSTTEPFAVCAQPQAHHFGCMSIVIPPGAVATDGKRARDVGKPKGRFASLYESRSDPSGAGLPDKVEALDLEGSGEEGGLSPADLRSAYRIPAGGGSGQTIAIVGAFDNPNAEADLKTFRAHYGLPECTAANGCFRKINQEGKTSSYPIPDPGWALETSLDLDMVSAICPNCHILLVEANNAQFENMGKAVEKAATYFAGGWAKATVISNSWGVEESIVSWEPESEEEEKEKEAIEKGYEEEQLALDKYFEHPGIPVLAAAGDSGYWPNYPASSQHTISVGGTNLYKTPFNERGWFEEAWFGSGGGCSFHEPKPAWQTDTGCAKRMGNDVAAVAGSATPVSVYDSYQAPGWINVSGTSASAPIVAGVEALSSATFREEGAQAFWKNQKSFFDVTTGFNSSYYAVNDCVPHYFCNAGPGYDGPTGNGTPKLEGGGESLPRKWTAAAMPAEEGESRDVSCTSSSFCLEVGAEENSKGFTGYPEGFATARAWNGSEWSPTADLATVKGGSRYLLYGVSCLSSTDCTAVGTYVNESGIQVPFAERWNGTNWSIQSTPGPSGANAARLWAVSCTSSTSCVAIGSYSTTNPNITSPFAERWNGSEWLSETLPVPGGIQTTSVLDVSCGSSTFCVATGGYKTEGEKGASLIEIWDGSKWSAQKIEPAKKVESPTFERSELSAISCTSASFCTAIGEYDYSWKTAEGGSSNASETLVEVWNGSSWIQQAGASEVVPSFSDISCSSSSYCEAVGFALLEPFSSSTWAVAERWNGSTWTAEKLPAEVGRASVLRGVSCTGTASCIATGYYRPGGHPVNSEWLTALALRISGTTLSREPIVPQSESRAVSCASENACLAVGGGVGGGRYASAAIWNGGVWNGEYIRLAQPAEAVSSTLAGISCPSAADCEAVGSYTDSSGTRKTLATGVSNVGHVNYLGWHAQTTPNPSGAKSSSLAGVSCSTTASACTAVGTYTDEGGTQRTLAESWNGSSWSIQTTPNPSGAKSSSLSSVSCSTTASACTAVGTYTDEAGVQRPLAESWNGSAWSIQTTPSPSGAKAASLAGVSCSSTTSACSAVGTYTNSSGTQLSLAEAWNGSAWSIQTTPNPSGAKAASLSSVSCPAAGSCSAVGNYTNSSGTQLTLEENWNGSSWSIQTTPNPEGTKAVSLGGVSCSGNLCMSVGSKTSNGSLTASISQARWGSGPIVSTVGSSLNSKGEPQLSGTVNPDGLATSYQFEYGLTTAYGSAIPVSAKEVGSGKTPVEVSQTIASGLKPGSVYHFRLIARNEMATSYGADMTFTTNPTPQWWSCAKQSGGRFSTGSCATEGSPNEWELLHLKEATKTTIAAKGNPISFASVQSGLSTPFTCETEVASPSLENPSGGGNGVGSGEVKYKGCKAEGTWGEKGCKVSNTASPVSKLELAIVESKTRVLLTPKEGESFATFTVSGCAGSKALEALNGAWKLSGTAYGPYSNASSKIELSAETTAGLKINNQNATAVGSIVLETTAGGYISAQTVAMPRWSACAKQGGGKYASGKCASEGAPNEWEILALKEAEKTTITAKGNPISFATIQSGISTPFTCETEVASPSLENPSGGGNGVGSGEVKYKGCKAEGSWGEKGCKVSNTASPLTRLELILVEGKTQVKLTPKTGESFATFTVSGCSGSKALEALNGAWSLTGSAYGIYSNSLSKIELSAATTAGLKINNQNATAVGSIGLETTAGGYVLAG
ncbi:MAG TPA: S53 family peptidase [Solirubrobacterales bacterium]